MNWLPKHKCGMFIEHNTHLRYYETIASSIDQSMPGYEPDDFISPEEMQKSIDTGEHWKIHWYPDTPVGFCVVSASSLQALEEYFKGETE